MAKTQDIKRRIKSIRNTMQLTRAMKMVSAAKLRRAQERIMQARPYGERTLKVLRSVSAKANPELNPLLRVNPGNNVEIFVVTADKGLCGAFNASILRETEGFIRDLDEASNVKISAIGKKGRDYFKARNQPVEREWVDVFRSIEFANAAEIGRKIVDLYVSGEADQIHLVYNEFKSAIQQAPVVRQLLPVQPPDEEDTAEEYEYEPAPQELLASLLPHYVEIQVFHALLESAAAEHAARMTAMDSATSNAGELIESLTLTMNRVRQASITTEIIEVVSGAESLG